MNITITGAGKSSLAIALFYATENNVTVYDENPEVVENINQGIFKGEDTDVADFLQEHTQIKITACSDKEKAYKGADYIIVTADTSYDAELNLFDSSAVEKTIASICNIERDTVIVLQSTVPIGFTERIKNKFGINNLIFIPEFARKGHYLHDLFHPYRLIVGDTEDSSEKIIEAFMRICKTANLQVFKMSPTEAEAVKLFANSYLAMRVAFFNELDTYAETRELSSENIINGVCSDPRIGNLYNNPSFGYGGIYFPDSTKQMKANFADIEEILMSGIVDANDLRIKYIAEQIIAKKPKIVGVYGVSIANKREEFNKSPEKAIIRKLIAAGIDVVMYEPDIEMERFYNTRVIADLDEFKNVSEIIMTDRYDHALDDVKAKVYTRDIFEK